MLTVVLSKGGGGDGKDAGGDDTAKELSEEEAETEPDQPENNELVDE